MHISKKCCTFAPSKGIELYESNILREKGYSFKIYSNEEERMHIHVIKEDKEAKFWLEPEVELAYKGDFSQTEINKIQSIVELYANHFKKQYQLHISGRIDD